MKCLENLVPDWNPSLYLKYEDERTRPARDLLAQVPIADAALAYDLGCGPGNSTELLVARFPRAEIVGLDSSAEMLERARHILPNVSFEMADLGTWRPERPADLLFANAVFQWVPDHLRVLRELAEALASGGILAVQMPDNVVEPAHVLMRESAEDEPWAERLARGGPARKPLLPPDAYYDELRPLCRRVDIWHTIYNHVLADAPAIVEWMMGSGLRPTLALLDEAERQAFLAAYTARIAAAYPVLCDGRVLLPFPRFFCIAVRA
jgi:trans-aconitate 2-methyltransferase